MHMTRLILNILIFFSPLIALCTLPWLAAWLARRCGRRGGPYGWAVFYVLLGVGAFCWFSTGLPSDEEMIAHFQAHRDEFEEVVRRYRNYPTVRNVDRSIRWMKEGDTEALMNRAGIKYVSEGIPWLPNPYTLETAKKLNARHQDPEYVPFSMFHKYGELLIKPAQQRYYIGSRLHRAVVWKDYYHFPELPRIEDGWLLGPLNTRGRYVYRRRVVSSANWFPLAWWNGSVGCVLRPIEPHWFLRLCTGR
jgi:hypothetical protein